MAALERHLALAVRLLLTPEVVAEVLALLSERAVLVAVAMEQMHLLLPLLLELPILEAVVVEVAVEHL
jgi:hypothetical protein